MVTVSLAMKATLGLVFDVSLKAQGFLLGPLVLLWIQGKLPAVYSENRNNIQLYNLLGLNV